jgi:hypothetical protein
MEVYRGIIRVKIIFGMQEKKIKKSTQPKQQTLDPNPIHPKKPYKHPTQKKPKNPTQFRTFSTKVCTQFEGNVKF